MSITLELTPQEEQLLSSLAAQRGLSLGEFARARLFEVTLSAPAMSTEYPDASWDQWADAGRKATDAARVDLRTHGISSVYRRDGVIVEELPDGTIRQVDSSL